MVCEVPPQTLRIRTFGLGLAIDYPTQAEVANLDRQVFAGILSMLVKEAVGRLQIAVPKPCRVKVLEPTEQGVQQLFDAVCTQRHICMEKLVEVGVASFHHKVNIIKSVNIAGSDDVADLHNVFMVQLRKDCNLTESSLAILGVPRENLCHPLDGH